MFIISKINGTVRSISDFRKLNTQLVHKLFPISKITVIMQKFEEFTYTSALDLNVVNFTIRLDCVSQDVCTIIMPWGKYIYQWLLMGVMYAPDIFQDWMHNLMSDIKCALTHLFNLLVLSWGEYLAPLGNLEQFLKRLSGANL